MSAASIATVEDALRLLHPPGEVFEVRILGVKGAGTVSGYFDDPGYAAAAIAGYDGNAKGVYHTINPVDLALLERAANRLRENVKPGGCTGDGDIVRRRVLPIDVDYKRPSETSATDAEVRAAGVVAKQIREHLEDDLHYPPGMLAMSGNGAHLLYAIDLPNDTESRDLVRRDLEKLAEDFGEATGAHVDTGIWNASRIMKVPGTMTRKGENTKDRPHRRSKIVDAPREAASVPRSALQALAGPASILTPEQQSAGGNGFTAWTVEDVEERLASWGVAVRNTKPEADATTWVLKVCPGNSEHDRGEAFVRRAADGKLSAGCQHNSCSWQWTDLRRKFDPEYAARLVVPVIPPAAREQADAEPSAPGVFIDWPTFWDCAHSEAEWVYPDVLARGRGHALYALHKAGKSLFMLYVAAQLATGNDPVVVVYLDYEMTEADVFDRLADMGYGPDTDFSRLRYALLPTLPPLDTAGGATALTQLVDDVQGEWPQHHLVVICDTISRAVEGKENDADTFRAFYTHTGIELKRRGITWTRLDHAGKDQKQGQRGSSGKGDDIDIVWKLTNTLGRVCLHRELTRMPWVPENVVFRQSEEPLAYTRLDDAWPPDTQEVAANLDRLGVSLDACSRVALDALKQQGKGRHKALVLAALKYRRRQAGSTS